LDDQDATDLLVPLMTCDFSAASRFGVEHPCNNSSGKNED
jgi:hypothetical protein